MCPSDAGPTAGSLVYPGSDALQTVRCQRCAARLPAAAEERKKIILYIPLKKWQWFLLIPHYKIRYFHPHYYINCHFLITNSKENKVCIKVQDLHDWSKTKWSVITETLRENWKKNCWFTVTFISWLHRRLSCHLTTNARVNQQLHSFIPFTGKLWNSLPDSVFPPSYNLNSFKRGVLRHLLCYIDLPYRLLYLSFWAL